MGLRYACAVFVLVSVGAILPIWLLVHPFVGTWRRLGCRATWALMLVLMAGIGTVLFQARDELLGRDLGMRAATTLASLPLFALAGWVRSARLRQISFADLAGRPELEASRSARKLWTHGIYGRIRHPRYLEVLVTVTGAALLLGYLGLYGLLALTVVFGYLVIVCEERELRAEFGERYAEYARSVPRMIPRRAGRVRGSAAVAGYRRGDPRSP